MTEKIARKWKEVETLRSEAATKRREHEHAKRELDMMLAKHYARWRLSDDRN